jgi:hypothetical protein
MTDTTVQSAPAGFFQGYQVNNKTAEDLISATADALAAADNATAAAASAESEAAAALAAANAAESSLAPIGASVTNAAASATSAASSASGASTSATDIVISKVWTCAICARSSGTVAIFETSSKALHDFQPPDAPGVPGQ